jgi:hypothetical protein
MKFNNHYALSRLFKIINKSKKIKVKIHSLDKMNFDEKDNVPFLTKRHIYENNNSGSITLN